MKEQGPIGQDRLTMQPAPSKLEVRGDIFMPEGTVNGPEQGQPPQSGLSEQKGRVGPRRLDPEKAARVQELLASLNKPGENASLAERRSFEMAQRTILENFGIMPIAGSSGDEPITPDEQPVEGVIDLETARRIASEAGVDPNTLSEESLRDLARIAQAQGARQQGRSREVGGSYSLYLTETDRNMLESGRGLDWLESKFDMIYSVAREGQELNSPIVSQLQQIFTFAANYLAEIHAEPSSIEEFNSSFLTRLNLIFMRSVIDHRNMEGAKEMSERLQTHGLFAALAMENGNVNRMFSRMAELLEDKRLAEGGKEFHVTPEMMSRLQDDLIEEQFGLAKKGVGRYQEGLDNVTAKANAQRTQIEREIRAFPENQGKTAEEIEELVRQGISKRIEDTIRGQIVRSVRTAYDVFVVSQRQGIIVARGHRLPGPVENYMSDPAGLFNVFNYEDLLTSKFNIFNKPADEFLTELKRKIAFSRLPKLGIDPKSLSEEELLDYGKRMFRDLFAVPDFFTSGWRIEGIQEAIKRRITWNNEHLPEGQQRLSESAIDSKLKDFGLFLQLKDASRTGSKDVWKRIAEIRPEEIVRLYRERAGGNDKLTAQMEKFFEGDTFRDFRIGSSGEHLDAFRTYDKFKQEFGPLIQILRQQGYDKFQSESLRIGQDGFDDAQKAEITKYFGGDETIGSKKAEQLREIFKHFTKIASEDWGNIRIEKRNVNGVEREFVVGNGAIFELMANDKFEDIYTRALLVDDALLDKLENPPAGSGITPLSRFWTSEVGGDALVRNYKDTENAAKAASNLLKFIYTEDPEQRIKAAEEFAEFTSQYNGQEGRAECVRYTVGSLLDMSKQDFIWDALGVAKLPFRQAMSKIEKIYGPQAMPMSRDQLRVQLDKIHSTMVAAIDRTGKTPEEIEKAEFKAEAAYRELEKLLEINPKNMVKRRAASFLFYLILAATLETYKLGESVVKAK